MHDQGPMGPPPLWKGRVVGGLGPMTPKIVTERPLRPHSLKPLFVRGGTLPVIRSIFACFLE